MIHIFPNVKDFVTIKSVQHRPIWGVGGSAIFATGVGTIHLHTAEGEHLNLENALYVFKSTVQLLSISKLVKHLNMMATFDNSKATLYDSNGKAIASATLIPTWGLYALNLSNDQAFMVYKSPDLHSWHLRLGHANYQSIIEMACAGIVQGMSLFFHSKPPKCDHCILDKQTRMLAPKRRKEDEGHRATRRLEKVWIDLAR